MQAGTHSYNLSQVLAELHEVTKETCYLGTEQNGEIVISEIKESRQALKVSALYVGYKDDAHARATTKIMMAYWPEAKARDYFAGRQLKKLTPSTLTDIDEICAELVQSRKQGYCLDEEAFVKGVCCISAPVFDVRGSAIACFSVSMPAEHYWSRRKEMIQTVCSAAERASRLLGFKP
jgi:DNA-binding IclR family transcriptional regulator